VPFYYSGEYSLYSFDMRNRSISIIDPTPREELIERNAIYKFYSDRIQKIGRIFDTAMQISNPKWNDDVYDWRRLFSKCVPKTIDV